MPGGVRFFGRWHAEGTRKTGLPRVGAESAQESEKGLLMVFAIPLYQDIKRSKRLFPNKVVKLISFAVNSLFPSVPVPFTLIYLEDLLIGNAFESAIVAEYSLSEKKN